MTTSPAVALADIGTPTPLHRVEKEISQQLLAAQGGDDRSPVQRVRMSNLVVFCDSVALAERVAADLVEIVVAHPARVLLLVGEIGQPTGDITARVRVQCRALDRSQQGCTEQVILHATGQGVAHLPFAVRSLLIGDLPTNLWWATPAPPALGGDLLYDLSENVNQIIYDSVGWPDPARGVAATAGWLESIERTTAGRWRVASDLNWRRLKYWRRILSEALSEKSAPGAAGSVTKLVVEHGPHAVVQGYQLVSWLSQKLGWTIRAGKATGGTETNWKFQTGKGEAAVTVKRQPDGEANIRCVRVSCTIDGGPVTMNLCPDGASRLSITLEGKDTAPRTVTVPPRTSSELIGRQLSDRERDPVFRQSMAVAQQLARSILG